MVTNAHCSPHNQQEKFKFKTQQKQNVLNSMNDNDQLVSTEVLFAFNMEILIAIIHKSPDCYNSQNSQYFFIKTKTKTFVLEVP